MLAFLLAATVSLAPQVVVVDARHEDEGSQVALATLEGQVNVKTARLFVVYRDEDAPWVPVLEKRLGCRFEPMSLNQALEHFRTDVKGQVWYNPDPLFRFQVNLATTIAGLEHAIATPRDLGLKTLVDLHDNWLPKDDLTVSAIENWLPKTNLSAVAYLDDGLPFFRDLIAQKEWFVFDLDPLNNEFEKGQLAKVLARYPPLTPVFGWGSAKYADPQKGQNDVAVEDALVDRLSRRDQFLVPADFADNVSFFSRLPAPKRLEQAKTGRKVPTARAYVTLIVSDGDNLQYDLNHMRATWSDPARPKIPLGWTVSPQWANLAPAVLDQYYQEAKERGGWDELVAGPSGFGYVNPGSMTADALGAFCKKTADASRKADLTSVVTLDQRGRRIEDVRRWVAAYGKAGVKALWLADMPPHEGEAGGTTYLGEAVRLGKDAATAARAVNGRAKDHRFTFVYVFAWELSAPMLADFVAGLDKDIAIVSPSEMAGLMRAKS